MTNFYKNFRMLCVMKNVSPSNVAKAIGLSNAAASGWKKGKMPSDITLEKLSQYFGVDVCNLLQEQAPDEQFPYVSDMLILTAIDNNLTEARNLISAMSENATKEKKKAAAEKTSSDLSEEEKEVLRRFRSLSKEKREAFLSLLD